MLDCEAKELLWQGDVVPCGSFLLHSQFDKVWNYCNCEAHVRVVSLVQRGLNEEPWGLGVSVLGGKPDSFLLISADTIQLGEHKILRTSLLVYNGSPLEQTVDVERIRLLAQLLPEISWERRICGEFDRHLAQELSKRVNEFLVCPDALHLAPLRGLGWGLTPSGDDFLLGFLSARKFLEKSCGFVFPDLFDAAFGENALVNSALMAARKWKFRKEIRDFISSLAKGSQDEIQTRVREVTAIGATSGEDFLAGFVAALKKETT